MIYYILAQNLPKGQVAAKEPPESLKGKGHFIAKFDSIRKAKDFIKISNELFEDSELSVWKENGSEIKI